MSNDGTTTVQQTCKGTIQTKQNTTTPRLINIYLQTTKTNYNIRNKAKQLNKHTNLKPTIKHHKP